MRHAAISTLIAMASVFAFGSARSQPAADPAPEAPAALSILYDQPDNAAGTGALAMNFLDAGFDIYDAEAADDFTVPASHVWVVSAIDVTGHWIPGLIAVPPANNLTMNVTFYKSGRSGGLPGAVLTRFTDIAVNLDQSYPKVAITLPSAVRLRSGTYWLSVQLNVDYNSVGGYWLWDKSTVQTGAQATWRNPGDGWGSNCPGWTHESDCGSWSNQPGNDHAFTLYGSLRR